jgi:iduronate 2-sulfatase
MLAPPDHRTAGRRTDSLVEWNDLFPTLADLGGLPLPSGLEGVSLRPVLNDPAATVKPAAFTQHPRPAYFDRVPPGIPQAMGYSVRTPRVRYPEWRDWKTGRTIARELYDARHDPAETRNQIDAPAFATAQREAEGLLRTQFPEQGH